MLISPLTDLLKNAKKSIKFTTEAKEAFKKNKQALINFTSIFHFDPRIDTSLVLTLDASGTATGAVLQQLINDGRQPLSFFSKKLESAQTKYSTFSRELLAIYLAIRHFRHLLEGRHFIVFTDNKPLTFALRANSDKCSPREIRQLNSISRFTTDKRFLKGTYNTLSDALSRLNLNTLNVTEEISLEDMAKLQTIDQTVQQHRQASSLNLKEKPLPFTKATILCDTSTGSLRPFVPQEYRKAVFNQLHNFSHPDIRATNKLISERFVWLKMN